MFYYYAQDTRQVTAARLLLSLLGTAARLAGRSATLPVGRAVNELRPRHGRDWRKPGNMQNPAYSMPFAVAGINTNALYSAGPVNGPRTATTTTAPKAPRAASQARQLIKRSDKKLSSLMRRGPKCGGGFSKGDILSCLYPPLT